MTERAGPWLQKFRAGFQRDAISYLLFLRLVPVFPFWLVNLALATTGVRLWTFTWTTFVGIVPGAIAFALAGAGLDSIAQAQKRVYEACVAAGGAVATGGLVGGGVGATGQRASNALVLSCAASAGCMAHSSTV